MTKLLAQIDEWIKLIESMGPMEEHSDGELQALKALRVAVEKLSEMKGMTPHQCWECDGGGRYQEAAEETLDDIAEALGIS